AQRRDWSQSHYHRTTRKHETETKKGETGEPVIGGGGREVAAKEHFGGVDVALLVVKRATILALDGPRVGRHRPVIVRYHLGRGRSGGGGRGYPRRRKVGVLQRPPYSCHPAKNRSRLSD
ncbi:hypothetical protein BHM03_00045284, partial [Ensete ventricosum]